MKKTDKSLLNIDKFCSFLFRYPFNVLLLNLGVVCCIECLLNMVSSSVYLITHSPDSVENELSFGWRFGWVACQINSYLMELTPLIYTIMLLTLLVDRAFAIKDPVRYKKNIRIPRQRCYLVLYWLLALISVLPIAVGLIESWPFPERYSCQVDYLFLYVT